MHVDLDDLRLFVQVAEAGNLTAGARRAFLSPPCLLYTSPSPRD